MAGNQVVYEIKVDGTSQALGEFAKIESALSGTAKKFSGLSVGDAFKGGELSKYAPQVDALKKSIDSVGDSGKRAASSLAGGFSGAFKQIAGDIDILAGPSAANLARGFSDAFGLFESVASKGVIGPIAAISVALGGVKILTDQWEKEIRDVEDAAQKATTAAANQIKSMAELAKKSSEVTKEVTTVETVNRRQREINERRRLAEGVEAEIQAANKMLETRIMSEEEYDRVLNEAWEKRMRLNKFNIDTQAMQDQLRIDHDKMLTKEANTAIAEESKKNSDEIIARRKEGAAMLAEVNKSLEDAQVASATWARDTVIGLLGDVSDEALKAKQDFDSWMIKADSADAALDMTPERKKELTDKERDVNAQIIGQLGDLSEKELQYKRALDERANSMIKANSESQVGAGINMAYGASTMVANAMMQPLIGTLQLYGTINRENWRELTEFNDEFRNNMAAQVQIALWSLAQQAAGKSVFEAGEGLRETALSYGAAATGNFVSASMHATSGMMHFVARDAYAGIAGVSAAGSIGVGMQRGDGGMFGLTKEERERRDRENGLGSTTSGPSLGGPVARGGTGGGGGPNVINFVYQNLPGAIDARSRDAAAATTASSFREARKSGYNNRMLRAG